MGPKKMLPRLSEAEKLQQIQERADDNARAIRTSTAARYAHAYQQIQERADDNARAIRTSTAARYAHAYQQIQAEADEVARAAGSSAAPRQANMPFDHMGIANIQVPENATDLTTTMQQPLGMTAPAGFDIDWSGFSTQEFENQSSFTTPTLNDDSPAPQYGQEQPMSPSTGGPQYGMSFMSDLPQYGMAGLPFSTGPQNGHSSSMDSNPRTFQYSSDAGFPLLPPYVPRAAQDVLSTEGLHQSFGDIARTADGLPLMAGEVTNSNNNPFPLTATHDGNFRYPQSQDTTLQQHQPPTGFGQPGQAHNSVSDGSVSARHDSSSSSPDNTVAINTQSRPSQPAALAPTANLGPCSKQTQMPPRPKPGRKPLPQEDAQDRRRLQNRMAQRSFRDKRAQKVSELQQDNQRIREQADHQHKLLSNALQGQKELTTKLTVENDKLKAELQAAIKRADDAERRLQRTSHSDGVMRSLNFPNATLQNIGSSTSLPPMVANWTGPVADHARASSGVLATSGGDDNNNNWAEYETDMTASWSNRKNNNAGQSNTAQNSAVQNNDNDSQWLSSTMDVDREKDQCGFCTDEGNCACMQSQVTQPQPQPQVQPTPPTIMPGGCDACLRDPARAAACKSMADQAEFTTRPNQNSGAINQRNDSMAPTPAMITCSSAIDRLGPNMPSIGDLFPGTFHAYPRASGEGFDLAEQEVAQVLQSMRRNTSTGSDMRN